MTTKRGPEGLSRRGFLAAAAATAAVGGATGAPAEARDAEATPTSGRGPVSVRVEGLRVLVETATLAAVLDRGRLVSLRNRRTGEEFLAGGSEESALALVYRAGERVPVEAGPFGQVAVRSLSATGAEVVVAGWDGDGVIAVPRTRRRATSWREPGAFSSRPGVRACRFTIGSIRPDLELVAPFFQGVRLPLDDALLRDSHWPWPMHWEAGLAILAGRGLRLLGSTRGTTGTGTRRCTSARAGTLARSGSTPRPGADRREPIGGRARVADWRLRRRLDRPCHAVPRLAVERVLSGGPRARAPRLDARSATSPSPGARASPRSSTPSPRGSRPAASSSTTRTGARCPTTRATPRSSRARRLRLVAKAARWASASCRTSTRWTWTPRTPSTRGSGTSSTATSRRSARRAGAGTKTG